MEGVAIVAQRETASTRASVLNALLACGAVSSVLYVAADVTGSMRYPGYNYAAQAFSELLAIGSPVRPFMMMTAIFYNLLVIAFGVAVILAGEGRRSVRVTGALLVLFGVFSAMGPYIPMHVRGTVTVLADLPHILITAAGVLAILAFLVAGAFTGGKAFATYTVATIAAVLAGGALAAQQVTAAAAGVATPMMGIVERLNIYGTMLWVGVFSVMLMRGRQSGGV
jgi:hypothetical protein